MKRQIKKTLAILLIICFALSITAAAVNAVAEDPNAGVVSTESKSIGDPNRYVVPIGSPYLGKTYGDWSADWWKWVFSIRTSKNPLLLKGEIGDAGQSGSVWFLAGTYNEIGIVRYVKIPAGKALFFPIINSEYSNIEKPGLSEQKLRALAKNDIDHVTVKEVKVDGKKLKNLDNFRVESKYFRFTFPEDNLLDLFTGSDQHAGSSKAVSDGYWIMLKPLPTGDHDISIHGKAVFDDDPNNIFTFETEVTYHITIKPK